MIHDYYHVYTSPPRHVLVAPELHRHIVQLLVLRRENVLKRLHVGRRSATGFDGSV